MLKIKNSQAGLETLANNGVATTNNTSQQQGTTETKDQTNKVAKQSQYKTKIQSFLFMVLMDLQMILILMFYHIIGVAIN